MARIGAAPGKGDPAAPATSSLPPNCTHSQNRFWATSSFALNGYLLSGSHSRLMDPWGFTDRILGLHLLGWEKKLCLFALTSQIFLM